MRISNPKIVVLSTFCLAAANSAYAYVDPKVAADALVITSNLESKQACPPMASKCIASIESIYAGADPVVITKDGSSHKVDVTTKGHPFATAKPKFTVTRTSSIISGQPTTIVMKCDSPDATWTLKVLDLDKPHAWKIQSEVIDYTNGAPPAQNIEWLKAPAKPK